jgi:hypothetical protein
LCVSCFSDSDCGGQFNPYCTSDVDAGNDCVMCVQPSQCPSTSPGCNSLYFQCGSCSLPSDCPSNLPVCQGTCVASCVLSDGGTSCASGLCDTQSGACVQCLSDSDCQSPTPYCADAGNYCVGCLSVDQCPSATPGCNSSSLSCGSCALSSDCPASVPVCQFGSCELSCASGGADCSDHGLVCESDSGVCSNCTVDSQCAGNDAGYHCGAYGYCGCQTAADCPAPSLCDQRYCVLSCTVDGGPDCSQESWVCDAGTGLCGLCSNDLECTGNANGPHCSYGFCRCLTGSDCDPTGACTAYGLCTTSCTADGGPDCSQSAEKFCDFDSGLCVVCASDTQCTGNASGPRCISYTGYCGCIGPQDCGSTAGCNSNLFTCGSCTMDSDCPTGAPHCSSSGTCGS